MQRHQVFDFPDGSIEVTGEEEVLKGFGVSCGEGSSNTPHSLAHWSEMDQFRVIILDKWQLLSRTTSSSTVLCTICRASKNCGPITM
ncbi:hypothetical protein BDDG_11672 [Blastomyces dermatitidis ATCC 18188]|uniref:Uncharacterized protein n=1 Tax=Ajellomyces dermatitidis (strain ATCC 18188 / CBS 674.68) TaxID=653446 RepID=A0A0J9HCE4_AJEDA|nr:hypothetical protein BDDG_11672 [Blastomyces dermatitidis ATCC 18188]